MREATVAPEISVVNSEVEAEHVKIRQNRAHRTRKPRAFWHIGSIETGTDTESSDCVRKDGGQPRLSYARGSES